jgi:hypothetical protein
MWQVDYVGIPQTMCLVTRVQKMSGLIERLCFMLFDVAVVAACVNNNNNNNNNNRHYRVSPLLYFNKCKGTRVQLDKNHWYEHVPKSVETSQVGKVTILCNQQVTTDRTIPNNKPGIIIRDNEKRRRMLIDVAISMDRNVIKKEAEKILKCKDVTIEIQRMWNVKTKVIPVIIGATGTISNSFKKYVNNTKLRNYRKQPYWALHTHWGKC